MEVIIAIVGPESLTKHPMKFGGKSHQFLIFSSLEYPSVFGLCREMDWVIYTTVTPTTFSMSIWLEFQRYNKIETRKWRMYILILLIGQRHPRSTLLTYTTVLWRQSLTLSWLFTVMSGLACRFVLKKN